MNDRQENESTMRKLILGLAAAGFLFGAAGVASAAPLVDATFINVTSFGTASFTLGGATGSASGSVATATIGPINQSTTFAINATGVSALQVNLVKGGTIAVTGSVAAGTAANAITGNSRAGSVNKMGVFLPLITIPVSAGNPGFTYQYAAIPGLGYAYVSVTGYAWAINPVTVFNVSVGPNGTIGTAMFTGSKLSTGTVGQVTLVSPSRVGVNAAGGAVSTITAGVSILTLSYVPEPGTLLLVGAGALGLAVLGRKRSA